VNAASAACVFCATDPSQAIARNALAYVLEDANPVTPGHCLVIPVRHLGTYFETTPDERAAIWELVQEIRKATDESRHPQGYNLGINIGETAGQTISHAHLHLIPRYTGDVPVPRGGVRGVIPSRQSYGKGAPMNGSYLRFYMHENRKVHGKLMYEWLLEFAKKLGVNGGTAFKAMAGFGRHGVLHEAKFFELAGTMTVEVEFLVSEEEATSLIQAVREAEIHVFYGKVPAEFGVIEGKY